MALKLQETAKGISCEYWRIITNIVDYDLNKTRSIIGLYVDQTQRKADVKGFLKREVKELDVVDVDRKAIYAKWKESKLVQKTDDKGNAVIGDDGYPVMVESNKFAQAKDV